MRAYLIALILLVGSLSGGLGELERSGIIVDCERVNHQNMTSATQELMECEIMEHEEASHNRQKKTNSTGVQERKDEYNPSNSENEANKNNSLESESENRAVGTVSDFR
tara:strand:+ start:2529 stop:2855 length:327 start_codon:yes stop_codon:yes gene_type:complete